MARPLSSQARAALQAGRWLRTRQIDETRQIPVFEMIVREGLELVFRPLDRLFGAYLPPSNTSPGGVLINANLPRALQRFTAGHELGHHVLEHGEVADKQTEIDSPVAGKEQDADAFAERLLMPEPLVTESLTRLGLSSGVQDFAHAYQLSLELGVSYRATIKRLRTLRYLRSAVAEAWFTKAPRDAKAAVAPPDVVENYRREAVIVRPEDLRTDVFLREGDVIAVEVTESPTTGYLWEVTSSGPARPLGERIIEAGDRYGSQVTRRVLFAVASAGDGVLDMELKRPWLADSAVRSHSVRIHGEAVPLGPMLSVA